MEQQLKNFKNCLQKEIPFCAAECPFHLDILDFIEKMKRGGFKGAFKTYRNAVGFPAIVSSICPEPCKGVCPRKDSDASIELRLLEQACVTYTGDRSPTDYNLPMKKKKVAVIGAGPSGLACALRLCMKKYEVEIFEEKDRIGGTLWELLDPEIFLSDIKEQFQHEDYTLHLNTPVQSIHELAERGFDAVYVATGLGGEDFGLLTEQDGFCAFHGGAGWFAGGGLAGADPIYALADGLHMGTVIDSFLKTGNLLYPLNERKTAMCLNPSKLTVKELVTPASEGGYSREEATQEAARCLECQCDFCRTYCDLTAFYNKWPLRIRDEILATTLPGSAEVKATPAKRLLSTCNQCGLCKETCPEEVDVGGLILEGRKSMHRQKKAPWVFHDFWLRDMDFANSSLAAVCKGSPYNVGKTLESGTQEPTSAEELVRYAFFPGCQLGASDPELVEKTYAYLLDRNPGTGLLLQCCGAPAEWSGDEEKHQGELDSIKNRWEELGYPVLIMACPTCEKKFKTYLEEIPVISLYEILDGWGGAQLIDPAKRPLIETAKRPSKFRLSEVGASGAACEGLLSEAGSSEKMMTYSIFDACASRHEPEMRASVRRVAERLGYALEPLTENDDNPRCCSFGGQPAVANPEYASFVTQKRISESDRPYITYCINCRDVFLDAGKETVHVLDLFFGRETPVILPTVSQRRGNRILLKERILEAYWGEDGSASRKSGVKLEISAELSEKLSRGRILEEDIASAVEFCQRTGRRVHHPDKGSYSGYKEVGYTTYWVEYREKSDLDFELLNAYAHHMKIELEAVWNGKKMDVDQ
ncbi:heterodisulfide reductase-related iron-sulfur binding cluster [Anoxybacterium hadale]|uniref:heterodisulfide reductase-related iron-sulfur binding cluster n=1 Tax=Anoxybacterium hadale TaxID=3408580 RepID=UPI003B00EEEB